MIRASIEIHPANSGTARRVVDVVVARIGGDECVGDYAFSVVEAPAPNGSPGVDAVGVLRGRDRRQTAAALVAAVIDAATSSNAEPPGDATERVLRRLRRLLDPPPPPTGSPASLIAAMLAITEAARLEREAEEAAKHPIAVMSRRMGGELSSVINRCRDGAFADDDYAVALWELVEHLLVRVVPAADADDGKPVPIQSLREAMRMLGGEPLAAVGGLGEGRSTFAVHAETVMPEARRIAVAEGLDADDPDTLSNVAVTVSKGLPGIDEDGDG